MSGFSFSDEAIFAVFDDHVLCFCLCLEKVVKLFQKIIVWGAISIHETSNLKIPGGTLYLKYIRVLEMWVLSTVVWVLGYKEQSGFRLDHEHSTRLFHKIIEDMEDTKLID